MRKLALWCCIASLATPLAALADPVEIETQSSGSMTVDSRVLGWLGLTAPPASALPYQLTIRTIMDPQAPGFMLATDDHYPTQLDDAHVDVTLTLGGLNWHYAGTGSAEVDGNWHSYRQYVFFTLPNQPSTRIDLWNEVFVPSIDFGAQPALQPPTVTGGATFSAARLSVGVNIASPDWQYGDMNGTASTYYVSLVPEAGQAAMLAAGLFVLLAPGALRAVRRQQ